MTQTVSPNRVGPDRPALAATLLVGGLFLLGLQDGLVKMISADVSIWQFQLLRSAINLALLTLFCNLIWGVRRPRPKRVWAVAIRSLFLAAAVLLFFGGVPFLHLSEIAAGLYVFPLFIVILSRAFLGERVGPRRVAAIISGMIGTLLILKPGTESFSPFMLLPVMAAACYAGTILTTRRLCREESPVTLAYGVAITFLGVGTVGVVAFSAGSTAWAETWPYVFTGWRQLEWSSLAFIAVCSCLNLVANIGLAKAYQSAEASWLAPFDYSYLIFATFWGFVFWGNLPDGVAALGMAIIAASGAYVAWQERRPTSLSEVDFNRTMR